MTYCRPNDINYFLVTFYIVNEEKNSDTYIHKCAYLFECYLISKFKKDEYASFKKTWSYLHRGAAVVEARSMLQVEVVERSKAASSAVDSMHLEVVAAA